MTNRLNHILPFRRPAYITRAMLWLIISISSPISLSAKPRNVESQTVLFPAYFDREENYYHVKNLPMSHGYKFADWMILYTKSSSRRNMIVGFGVVAEISNTGVFLAPQSMRPDYYGADLLVGPVNDTGRIGKFRASIVGERPNGYVINIGSGVGVRIGDCYRVLGDPVVDIVPGISVLGYEEIGTMEVIQSDISHARLRLVDGSAIRKLAVEYITNCTGLSVRKLLATLKFQGDLLVSHRDNWSGTLPVLESPLPSSIGSHATSLLKVRRISRKTDFAVSLGVFVGSLLTVAAIVGFVVGSAPPALGPIPISP